MGHFIFNFASPQPGWSANLIVGSSRLIVKSQGYGSLGDLYRSVNEVIECPGPNYDETNLRLAALCLCQNIGVQRGGDHANAQGSSRRGKWCTVQNGVGNLASVMAPGLERAPTGAMASGERFRASEGRGYTNPACGRHRPHGAPQLRAGFWPRPKRHTRPSVALAAAVGPRSREPRARRAAVDTCVRPACGRCRRHAERFRASGAHRTPVRRAGAAGGCLWGVKLKSVIVLVRPLNSVGSAFESLIPSAVPPSIDTAGVRSHKESS